MRNEKIWYVFQRSRQLTNKKKWSVWNGKYVPSDISAQWLRNRAEENFFCCCLCFRWPSVIESKWTIFYNFLLSLSFEFNESEDHHHRHFVELFMKMLPNPEEFITSMLSWLVCTHHIDEMLCNSIKQTKRRGRGHWKFNIFCVFCILYLIWVFFWKVAEAL